MPPSSSAMSSGIRDNHTRGLVGEFLRDKIQAGARLSIVSAYFTIYAFEALKKSLNSIEEMDFLFGEPRFIQTIDPDKAEYKIFAIEEDGLKLVNYLEQKRVARECADWIREKVRIKSIRQSNLLHGKMYHVSNSGIDEALMGSSNFTLNGLGLGQSSNIELNLEVDSSRDRQDLKAWFDELWQNDDFVIDVKDDVLGYLERLYANNAPEFIYYKTLFHLFSEYLADQDQTGLTQAQHHLIDTEIWKTLYEFQKDGVRGAINKILTHDGCIIADSVGLGKTYEALAVIKYFEIRNHKVLVLCPKKLRENWTVYQAQNNSPLNPFVHDRFSYTVLSHSDLSRDGGYSGDIDLATLNWSAYDLIVIDESHNFRNNTRGRRDEDGNVIRKSRYERLMEDILKSGIPTKVLLLSATPVNTDLNDLRNQLYLITEGRDDAFTDSVGIPSIRETLTVAQRRFNEWAKEKHSKAHLFEQLSSGFFTLLDGLTIARSRGHIRTYYEDTLEEIGTFPERLPPISIYPDIDLEGMFPSYDRLNDEISNYQLSLFNPIKYVLPAHRAHYEAQQVNNFTQEDREHYLIGMMKVNYLKRLESSVYAFGISMRRTIERIAALEKRIERFKTLVDENPDLDVDALQPDAIDDEELRDALQIGKGLKYSLAHMNLDAWLKDLAQDKQQLNLLAVLAKDVKIERDAKLYDLKSLIESKVQSASETDSGSQNRKVIVFTAFADTAMYLYDALEPWASETLGVHIALVTGGTSGNKTTLGHTDFQQILTNFSPIAKHRAQIPSMPQDEEIDLLIATDCISEGQNLQDCDYLVNYDIHWNPVRLIQRFGRIDRLGSRNPSIQMVNFWPTEDLNKYIDLKHRVESRMALVDVTATGQDNILDTEDIESVLTEELHYRDQQLLRLKDEVLDLEDFNETVALNEFTLDDFRIDLIKYLESNRKQLEEAPLGLYAVVSPDPMYPAAGPGVIFCLRQKGDGDGTESVNPLKPYYLVYMRDDGELRYAFTQAKQILDIFRQLCTDKTTPNETLCALFDVRTKDGNDMAQYSGMLEKAVDAIIKTFRRRSASHLTSNRNALLTAGRQQIHDTADFELVTWLAVVEQ